MQYQIINELDKYFQDSGEVLNIPDKDALNQLIENINLVEKYKGCTLLGKKDLDLLEDGEYYIGDLIGCEVYDKGELIGKVSDVHLYDHHDVLVVKGKKKIMIPYVEAFVLEEDIDNKRIDVDLIEGFYNED